MSKRRYEDDDGRTIVDMSGVERPNLFTTSVANIGPGEEVIVAIEYQQTLRYDEGTFRLRFPLAVTPRYIPGTPVAATADGTGWSRDYCRNPAAYGNPHPQPIGGDAICIWRNGRWVSEEFRAACL